MVLRWVRDGAESKVGITVRRSVGKAVTRNHLKRRLRESLKKIKHSLPRDLQMVIVGKKAALELNFREMVEDLQCLLRRAGIVEG